MTAPQRRQLVGIALPLFCVAGVVAVWSLTTVPDPLATHWDWRGEADGSMSRSAFGVLAAVLIAPSGLLAYAAVRRPPVASRDLVAPVAIATFLQWTFAGVVTSVLVANTGAGTWTEARSLTLPVALITPFIAGLVAAGAARTIAGRGPERSDRRTGSPTVGKRDAERLAWFGRSSTRWPLAVGSGLAVVGSLLVFTVGIMLGVGLVLAGAAVTMLATIRVVVDRSGLTVAYGPFGWPRTKVTLDRIDHAEVIDVRPMSYGGWGYRGSLRLFRRAAVVLRAGPGIELELIDGRRFVVTVDDAETGAGTINDLLLN